MSNLQEVGETLMFITQLRTRTVGPLGSQYCGAICDNIRRLKLDVRQPSMPAEMYSAELVTNPSHRQRLFTWLRIEGFTTGSAMPAVLYSYIDRGFQRETR